jgi:hypothetical protein
VEELKSLKHELVCLAMSHVHDHLIETVGLAVLKAIIRIGSKMSTLTMILAYVHSSITLVKLLAIFGCDIG